MLKLCVLTAAVGVSLVGAALRAQDKRLPETFIPPTSTLTAKFEARRGAIVDEISFIGLRRISAKTLASQIVSRGGEPLDAAKIEKDVRTLGQTDWFETVRAEIQASANTDVNAKDALEHLQLIFYVPERPFLTKVEYSGSDLLSQSQIKKLLKAKKLETKLGSPENPAGLDATRRAIESALKELARPRGTVKIIREESSQATVQVRFEITDGPHLPVGRVLFKGTPAISERNLTRQMRRVSPDSLFAGLRGRNAYSREGFEEDRERLLAYHYNHGYPEARIGTPRVYEYTGDSWRWIPWPHKIHKNSLGVTIPIEAGTFYHTASVATTVALEEAAGPNGKTRFVPAKIRATPVYSAQDIENLRRAWEVRVHAWAKQKNGSSEIRDVEVIRTMDASAHSVRITLDLSPAPRYPIRRLEFRGIHHFPDRYFRKTIGIKEGEALQDRALEAGLRRLARTGYFKPIKKEDIQVTQNDLAHTIDVTIYIEELGLQRVSMVGGSSQFRSTLGIAYSLFNILDREELITSRIEGGPESLQLALSLAKEGFLGSRGSLALSVFNTFLKPRFTESTTGPFYNQNTKGATADWSYALSDTNTFSANYTRAYSATSYSPTLTSGVAGLPIADVTATSSSHAVGAGFTHDAGNERVAFADSVSGGFLGGSENVLRAKVEYGRISHDPIFGDKNAWAFRTTFAGAGSYCGGMPLTSRLFAGDAYVRGLRDGELGPSAVVSSGSSNGGTVYTTTLAGANLIGALNVEYRVRFSSEAEVAGFFDLGSGMLLPNWLGLSRPWLVNSSNGVIHGSTGIELRWTVPGVQVPLRVYYALNILRLNRPVWLPDGTLTHVQNRFAAIGWGLGSLF